MEPTVQLIIYRGIKYRRYPGRRYFSPGHADRKAGIEDLHREVWKHERGPIPLGWHVHHINLNSGNNHISNLECLTPAEHEAIHAADRSALGLSPEHQAHLKTIRFLAAKWHKSDAGRAWHVEHGKESWVNRESYQRACDQCGSQYDTRSKKGTERFCSNACKSAARRASGVDNQTRTCAQCGAEFVIDRYSKTRTCTKSCGAKMRWAR